MLYNNIIVKLVEEIIMNYPFEKPFLLSDIHNLASLDLEHASNLNEGSAKDVIDNYRGLLKRIEDVIKSVPSQTIDAGFYQDAFKLVSKCEKAIRRVQLPQKIEVIEQCKKIEDFVATALWSKQEKKFDSFCREDLKIQDQNRIAQIKKEVGFDATGSFQITDKTLIFSKQVLESVQESYFWPFFASIIQQNPQIEKIQISGELFTIPLAFMQKIMKRKSQSTSTSPPIFVTDFPLYSIGKMMGILEIEEVKGMRIVSTQLPIRCQHVEPTPIKGIFLELLASDSPYFNASFESGFSEAHDRRLNLPEEISFVEFKEALDCLYSNRQVTEEDLPKFLKIANYYNIPSLFDKCSQFLNKQWVSFNYSDLEVDYIRKQHKDWQEKFPALHLGPMFIKFYEKALQRAFGTPKFFEILDECAQYQVPVSSLDLINRWGSIDWKSSLTALEKLPTLKKLHIQADTLQDQDFQYLAKLGLEEFSLRGGKCQGQGLQYLKDMNLVTLRLTRSNSLLDLSFLPLLTSLKTLDLNGCYGLPQNELQFIALLPLLESLDLSANLLLSDSGLQYLAGISTLRELNLEENANITDTGIQHLPAGLEELGLYSCSGITDATLLHIGQNFSKLQRLNLANTKITDNGLRYLTGFPLTPPIRELNLNTCLGISHSGVQNLLVELPLETLKLNDTNVNKRNLKEIENLVFKTFGKKITDLQISPYVSLECYIPYHS